MDSAVSMNARIATMPETIPPVLKKMPERIPSFPPATSAVSSNSMLVTRWLERLLQHFGVHELGAVSDQNLAALLARCGEDRLLVLQDSHLLSELRRRVVRLAGAQLDDAFITMAPDIVAEDDIEPISLSVESQHLKGVRYQNEVYRLVESFDPCYRLHALCLGQTLAEKALSETIADEAISTMAISSYLITRSTERFAVWVNVRMLSTQRYPHHLSSTGNILDLAG